MALGTDKRPAATADPVKAARELGQRVLNDSTLGELTTRRDELQRQVSDFDRAEARADEALKQLERQATAAIAAGQPLDRTKLTAARDELASIREDRRMVADAITLLGPQIDQARARAQQGAVPGFLALQKELVAVLRAELHQAIKTNQQLEALHTLASAALGNERARVPGCAITGLGEKLAAWEAFVAQEVR